MLGRFGISFNSGKFAHIFVGRAATRKLKGFLDGIGHERLQWLIENKKDLITYLPPEYVHKTVQENPLSEKMLEEFPNEEVYTWLPAEYRAFFEQSQDGRAWVFKQLDLIRNLFVPS